MERWTPSDVASGNVKWFSLPAIPLLEPYPRELKIHVLTKTCTWMCIVALFIMAKELKPLKCLPTDNWMNERGLSMQWDNTQP